MLRQLARLLFGSALAPALLASVVAAPERDYPFTPVPFTDVHIDDAFWGPRLETNRRVTVRYDFDKCEETGRIANFARAGGLEVGGFRGTPFDDSDVVKVVEGAAYTLALTPDPELETYLDGLIAKIAAAQEEDGYLYTARTLGRNDDFTGATRWSNLRVSHELYNVGHMYEAAVAHYQATGKRTLLDVAIRNADLVCKVFGPGEGQRVDVPGHQEIEIGLVRLYRVTGDEKYLRQAKFFVDMRGRGDKRPLYGEYCQDHAPIVEQTTAVGHAVRGGYFYAGVADVAAMTGERAFIDAIGRVWEDVVGRKLYLTGNVGQHGHGEGYEGAYKLPNERAYNETCAAIALAMWNHRMFLLHGDAKYIDVLERIIYNGFLAGVSLSGDRFFYPNPLACDMRFKFNHGELERSPWFGCSCCPVNVVRYLPSIAGAVYAHRDDAAYVNLFISGRGTMKLSAGEVTFEQRSRYPWSGDIEITVRPREPVEFTLCVRIPGWARGEPLPSDLYRYTSLKSRLPRLPVITIGGERVEPPVRDGYAVLRRHWKPGDTVRLELPLAVRRVRAHEAVEANHGRVAFERGPIVYCVEGADHGGRVSDLFVPDGVELEPVGRPELLGGVTVLEGEARAAFRGDDGGVDTKPARLTLIPYYAWCHRGANEMAVWLPEQSSGIHLPPPPTLASTSRASASHVWSADTVEALNDRIEPKSSDDHSIARFTWWDRRGGAEWVQYDFKSPTSLSAVAIYWFDDTGRGECRVPASWRLLYRDGETWKPVTGAGAHGVARDRYNRVAFDRVTTTALRVEARLQDGYSGGILEWTLEE